MSRPWKIAIIGGGPGGLAAAIALSQLNAHGQPPSVEWTLYEKKPRISETGGGISLQQNTWHMLELLGVADRIDARDFFRPEDGRSVEHRNAVTGVLIAKRYHSNDIPLHRTSCRMVRSKLQRALLSAVDETRIQVSKKLVKVEQANSLDTSHGQCGIHLFFDDGEEATFDLVVGADGIRSVVRQFVAPGHMLQYNGQSAYRTILRKRDVASINGIPKSPVFWQYVRGKYVYTCPLGGDDFELTVRIRPDETDGDRASRASWGQPYDLNQLIPKYVGFAPPLRSILRLAADVGGTQEFALFNGPRLTTCVATRGENKTSGVVLLGDASHPLSGAFGAGAGFAFEDAYTLSRALAWALQGSRTLVAALAVYDEARSSHYANLYKVLDHGASVIADVASQQLTLDEEISERVRRLWLDEGQGSSAWVYQYRADEFVERILAEKEKQEDLGEEEVAYSLI